MYAMKQVEYGIDYHLFCMKYPDYVRKLMTEYGTLEPTDKKTRKNSTVVVLWRQSGSCTLRWLQIIFGVNIKLMTTTTVGMHPSPLRKLGPPNIDLIVALVGTLRSHK